MCQLGLEEVRKFYDFDIFLDVFKFADNKTRSLLGSGTGQSSSSINVTTKAITISNCMDECIALKNTGHPGINGFTIHKGNTSLRLARRLGTTVTGCTCHVGLQGHNAYRTCLFSPLECKFYIFYTKYYPSRKQWWI